MTTREALLAAVRDSPGITEDELRDDPRVAQVPPNGVRPGRMRLWLAGLIEPDSEAGWEDALANRVKEVRWCCVDAPERREEVARRAATRKSRIATSPEERARRIVDDLGNPTVRRLVDAMMRSGAGSARAQRSFEQALRRTHADRRQAARQAQRDSSAQAEFKRMLAQLWDARGAVGAIDAHLIQERARVANDEPRRISDDDWIVALNDVRTIIKSFGSMWQNVRDLGDPDEPCPACGASQLGEERHLPAFVVDGEVVDVADDETVDAEAMSP